MSSEDVLTQRQNKEFIQNPVLLCPLPRVYLHLIYSYIFMYISIYYVYIIYIYIIYTVKVPTRNLSMQNWLCYSMKHVKKNIYIYNKFMHIHAGGAVAVLRFFYT